MAQICLLSPAVFKNNIQEKKTASVLSMRNPPTSYVDAALAFSVTVVVTDSLRSTVKVDCFSSQVDVLLSVLLPFLLSVTKSKKASRSSSLSLQLPMRPFSCSYYAFSSCSCSFTLSCTPSTDKEREEDVEEGKGEEDETITKEEE